MATVALGVSWAKEPNAESKRVEMASGFIRRLRLEPGARIKVKLDLDALYAGRKKKIDRSETGWNVTYHHDDWLLVEGRIQGGVDFRYTRADSQRQAVQSEVRGNTRITRTRTQGWFHDAVALRFSPDAFPEAAQLGPDAYKKLKLPEGLRDQALPRSARRAGADGDLGSQVGRRPPGAKLDGGDAVMIAGLWLTILFDLLGARSEPFQREGEPPPSPDARAPQHRRRELHLGPDVPGHDRVPLRAARPPRRARRQGALPPCVDGRRQRHQRGAEAKNGRDARTREAAQKRAQHYRDAEDTHLVTGGIQIGVGLAMVAAGGAGAVFGALRRKKKAAKVAAELAAENALPSGYPQAPGTRSNRVPMHRKGTRNSRVPMHSSPGHRSRAPMRRRARSSSGARSRPTRSTNKPRRPDGRWRVADHRAPPPGRWVEPILRPRAPLRRAALVQFSTSP